MKYQRSSSVEVEQKYCYEHLALRHMQMSHVFQSLYKFCEYCLSTYESTLTSRCDEKSLCRNENVCIIFWFFFKKTDFFVLIFSRYLQWSVHRIHRTLCSFKEVKTTAAKILLIMVFWTTIYFNGEPRSPDSHILNLSKKFLLLKRYQVI